MHLQKVPVISKKKTSGKRNLFFVACFSAADEKKQDPDPNVSGNGRISNKM